MTKETRPVPQESFEQYELLPPTVLKGMERMGTVPNEVKSAEPTPTSGESCAQLALRLGEY